MKVNLVSAIDSWGKVPPGILQGNFNWLGSYGECTNLTAKAKPSTPNGTESKLRGKYCTVILKSVNGDDIQLSSEDVGQVSEFTV